MRALFAQLPESNPVGRRRSPADVAVSVAVHAAVITFAVAATLHAGVPRPPAKPRVTELIYVGPQLPHPPRPERRSNTDGQASTDPLPVDRPASPLPPEPFTFTPPDGPVVPALPGGVLDSWPTGSSGQDAATVGPSYGDGGEPWTGAQVEVPAAMLPGAPPRYPTVLRETRVEGRVVVRFVVDSTGRVEPATLQVVSSSHELFTAAVRAALPALRFTPASVQGRRVRQLVELPFEFALER